MPIYWLWAMADVGIPDKLLPAIRVSVFWIALPFIGLLLGGEDIRSGNYYWAAGWFGCGYPQRQLLLGRWVVRMCVRNPLQSFERMQTIFGDECGCQ
jgi:hypothetical protein